MLLQRLTFSDFRNFHELDLEPAAGLNVFVGSNAQGKSNLLEGIAMLGTGKSFRTTREADTIARGADCAVLSGQATLRAGRILLAGDAAHVNNPIGGMGLNGGIQDAVSLSDKLIRILLDGAPERLLDLYDLQRRTVAIEFVQEQSIANKKRLEARDADVRKRNLDELRQIAANPERARQFLLRTSMIASQQRAEGITLARA